MSISETALLLRDGSLINGFYTPPFDANKYVYINELFKVYESGPVFDPDVVESYAAFREQILLQFKAMRQAGVNVIFTDDDPTPLVEGKPSFKAYRDEVNYTEEFRIYRSQGNHPILDMWFVSYKGRFESMNSIFRAVHDFYGHLACDVPFNWRGETLAYYSHRSTLTEDAHLALFLETVAQQAYYYVKNDYVPLEKLFVIDPIWFNPPIS